MSNRFKVIDISTWQKQVDYMKVKADNPDIKGVILRVGYTGWGVAKSKQIDEMFETHYAGFKYVGLPIGVYWYSCAVTPAEAREEARLTLEYIKGKQLDFPVWWDTEDNHDLKAPGASPTSQASIGVNRLTDCAVAFCKEIENAGYYVGIYASAWWFNNRLELYRIKQFDKWVAHYGVDTPGVGFTYGMHQYTDSGVVAGIRGGVDLNWSYKDYHTIIKRAGLNGYPKDTPPKPDKNSLITMHLTAIRNHCDMIDELIGGKDDTK